MHVEFNCYSVNFVFFLFFLVFQHSRGEKEDTRPRFGVAVLAGGSSGLFNPVMLVFLCVLFVPFSLRFLPGH